MSRKYVQSYTHPTLKDFFLHFLGKSNKINGKMNYKKLSITHILLSKIPKITQKTTKINTKTHNPAQKQQLSYTKHTSSYTNCKTYTIQN